MNNVNYYYYPPTNHPFPACNNNCGSWYFILGGKGREGKGREGKGREVSASVINEMKIIV